MAWQFHIAAESTQGPIAQYLGTSHPDSECFTMFQSVSLCFILFHYRRHECNMVLNKSALLWRQSLANVNLASHRSSRQQRK